MAFIGSDPEKLNDLATKFDGWATELEGVHSPVQVAFSNLGWHGPDADNFQQIWAGPVKSRLTGSATTLRDAAEVMRKNSYEQIRVSSGTSLWSEVQALVEAAKLAVHEAQQLQLWATTVGLDQINGLMGASPEEVLKWWNSLTSAQQAALIAMLPGQLLFLNGLPGDVRIKASEQWAKDKRDDLVMASEENQVKLTAKAGWVKVSANLAYKVEELGNGKVTVSLIAGADFGYQAGTNDAGGSVTLGAEGTLVYEFGSQAEADKFLKGLATAVAPDDRGDILDMRNPPAYVASEIKEYLDSYKSAHTNSILEGHVNGELHMSAGGTDISIGGEAGVQYETKDGTTTVFLEGKYEGSHNGGLGSSLGPAVSADGSMRYELVRDRAGEVVSIKAIGTYSAAGGVGTDYGAASTTVLVGASGTYTVDIDLKNPANGAAGADLLKDVARGNWSGASQNLNKLADNSSMIIQTDAVGSYHAEVKSDIKVGSIKGEFDRTRTAAQNILVKPPRGVLTKVSV